MSRKWQLASCILLAWMALWSMSFTNALENDYCTDAGILEVIQGPSDFTAKCVLPDGTPCELKCEDRTFAQSEIIKEIDDWMSVGGGSDSNNLEPADIWLNGGDERYGNGLYKEAITYYDNAVSIDPNLVEAWYGKGNSLFQLKRYTESLEAYEAALRVDPNNADILSSKGDALFRLNRLSEALEAYNDAISINPQHAAALRGRESVLETTGNPEGIGIT